MPHELTERDDLILRVVECLGFVPEDELKHGAEVYKISDDPTVSLPSVLVETGRMSKKHMDAVEAVVDARLAAEKSLAATHRVSSSEKMDEITREKEEARKRAAEAGVFSARSKKDVKSAWAAYKKGADSAQPEEAAPGVEESVQTAPRAAPGRKPQLQPIKNPAFEHVRRSRTEPAAEESTELEAPPQAEGEAEPKPGLPLRTPAPESPHRKKDEPKMDIPQEKKFVPSWMREKKEAPGGGESAEAAVQEEPEEKGEDLEKQLHVFVARALRSRLHQQMLEDLVTKRIAVIDSHEVARALDAKEKEVRRVLDDWRTCGIVKQLGSHPYALSPGKKDLQMIRTFMKLWSQANWHSKLLRMILAHESEG